MKKFHIVPDQGNWKALEQGTDHMVAGHENKEEVVKAMARFANSQKEPISVIIHGMDGTIQEERTYPRSADPKKVRDEPGKAPRF